MLRAILAWRGGQLFWPDEDRFEQTRRIAGMLADGRFVEALSRLLAQPDHILFKAAGLVPAGLEHSLGTPGWVSALFFAAASTWVLWLVQRVARAAGGSPKEALVALILAAATTSLFYYSRHFFPYDFALGLFLLSLLRGIRRATTTGNSLLTGLWAGLGFLAYNGYWSLGAVLMVLHVALAGPHLRALATRLTYALLGLSLPIFCLAGLSRLFGHDFFTLILTFAGTANQGELDQVWLFTLQYLWSAEHGLALLWAVTLVLAVDRRCRPLEAHGLLWPGLSLLLAALLILPPEFLHHFAVTARHIRVLAPFFCLAAASVLCRHPFWTEHPRRLALTLWLVAVQAGFNFAPPLTQIFPREYESMAIRYLDEARKTDLGPYKIINASFLHNPNWAPAGPDHGTVHLRRSHPFQFTPYLFEGYSTALRNLYIERDLSMRIVRIETDGPPLQGYPDGMIELLLRFPTHPESLLPEPLLSTGVPGHGDTLFIRYDGSDHFVLGHDHIGGGATHTPRLPLDRQRPHRVLIGMDTFYAPSPSPRPARRFVIWDDQILLQGRADLHPTAPNQITIGHNFIGASTAITQLSADILSFRRLRIPEVGASFPAPPGALRLEFLRATDMPAGQAEPLLSAGPAGMGDLLYLRHEGDGRLRIGHDHWGSGALLSEPFVHDAARRLELIIAMGPFLPTAEPGSPAARRLYVASHGQIIFNRFTTFHPSAVAELILAENHAASTAVARQPISELLMCEPVSISFPAETPDGYPGAVKITLRFPEELPPGLNFPLLCTGRNGAGDLLFIRSEGQGLYRIGHDHWGHPMMLSAPHSFGPGRTLELTVAMGSLSPPAESADTPDSTWHHRLLVMAGTDILLNQMARFHPAESGAWVVGLNTIGASSADELLPADLLDFSPVSLETIGESIQAP